MATVSLNGYSADIIERYGIVVDVQHWSETHVSGSGGEISGHIVQGTGHISGRPISIETTVANRLRVFIKYQDGTEEARVVSDDFPMRIGHRVLLRYVVIQGRPRLALYRNLDTRQEWTDLSVLILHKPVGSRSVFYVLAIIFVGVSWLGLDSYKPHAPLSSYILIVFISSILALIIAATHSVISKNGQRRREIVAFQSAVENAVAA